MKDLKHLFVPYYLAVQMKEKGFKEPCLGWFPNSDTKKVEFTPNVLWVHSEGGSNIPAPLYQQVVDWLFKELQIHISTVMLNSYQLNWQVETGLNSIYVDTREQAIEEALKLI